jgi:hypothetical protein
LSFIYYASPLHVDQLHAACIGEVGQRTVTKESDAGTTATAEAGLAKFFAAIADLRGRGSVDFRRKKVETLQVTQSPLDRAQAVLAALETRVPPIETRSDGIFWYSLPTRLAPRKRGSRAVIEVSCKLQNLALAGATSVEHWVSASLRNNLLTAAAKAPDGMVPTFGIVLPLHTDEAGGQTRMQVQFIIIASPDTWVS